MFVITLALLLATVKTPALTPHPVSLSDGRRFELNLPPEYELRVAADGLRRVRFMAMAPDGRLFVTDLYNRTDNKRGKVYVLDGFDRETGRFAGVIYYVERAPNHRDTE